MYNNVDKMIYEKILNGSFGGFILYRYINTDTETSVDIDAY